VHSWSDRTHWYCPHPRHKFKLAMYLDLSYLLLHHLKLKQQLKVGLASSALS
jgi:hypothetical protein